MLFTGSYTAWGLLGVSCKVVVCAVTPCCIFAGQRGSAHRPKAGKDSCPSLLVCGVLAVRLHGQLLGVSCEMLVCIVKPIAASLQDKEVEGIAKGMV